MLKKKGLFSVIFSIVFCFAAFVGVLQLKNQRVLKGFFAIASSASDVTFSDVESGEDWSYDGTGCLSLNGVEWTSELILPEDSTIEINLTNENTIAGLVLNGSNLTISGSGSLQISGSPAILANGYEEIVLQDGINVCIEDCDPCQTSVEIGDLEDAQNVRFFNPVSNSTHEHDFEFIAKENVLTIKCLNDGCSIGSDGYSETITVSDVDYGTAPKYVFNFERLKENTGIDLKGDFESERYYKITEPEDVLVENPEEHAGDYYLLLQTSSSCEIGEKQFICYFKVNKLNSQITSQNKTIKYNKLEYNLDNLFLYDGNEGSRTFSIVGENVDEIGSIQGNKLTIKKSGAINIHVVTSGTENYNGAEADAVLTVQKADFVAGTESGQLMIVMTSYIDGSTGNEYDLDWWIEGQDIGTPRVWNKPEGIVANFTYWLDVDCETTPTTRDHGANKLNGLPSVMGVYYAKAEIQESDLYNGITLTKKFTIKRPIGYNNRDYSISITYKDLDFNKYDLRNMIKIDEECEDAVDLINFYLVEEYENLVLDDVYLEIPSISGNGYSDRYYIGFSITPKEDSLYSSCGGTMYLDVMKSELDKTKLGVDNLVYGETQIQTKIEDNPYDGDVSVNYFYDEECVNPIRNGELLNVGTYYARIVIAETDFTLQTTKITSFNVNKKPVEVIWQQEGFIYNGEIQSIYAQYLDINNNPIRLNAITDVEFKNVQVLGEDYLYTAFAYFSNNETNYVLSGDLTKNYRIMPAVVEVEFLENGMKDYGESTFNMNVGVVSGEFFDEVIDMFKYNFTLNDQPVIMGADSAVGVYRVSGESNNSNYNIVFKNTAEFYVKNKFISLVMNDWTWSEVASNPTSEVGYGVVEYAYYLGGYESGELLNEKPSEPGSYTLVAQVENNREIYGAFASVSFNINKIVVNVPDRDSTVYVYDGMEKTYYIDESKINGLYTISKRNFDQAGNYKIRLTLNDSLHYRWSEVDFAVYELDFVIHKKSIEKPIQDTRKFKYNGKPLTYIIEQSVYYNISNNTTQTDVGVYDVIISLNNPNYMWSDGNSEDLIYKFVINRSKIENPTIVDSLGNELKTNDVSIVFVDGGGLNPDDVLNVEVLTPDDSIEINETRKILKSKIDRYDKIFKVANIVLSRNGENVQPDNPITLKILVPKELINANFKLYHIHEENGVKKITEIDYSDIDEDGYITFQTSKLSSFVFVYNKTSLVALIVIFSILSAVMSVLFVMQLRKLRNIKIGSKATMSSVVPVFYVFGEVVSSIVLGIIFGVLTIANIVLFILNMKNNKLKQSKNLKSKN